MSDEPTNVPPRLIDSGSAPTIFADAVSGVYLLNGALRLTFEAHHVDHNTSPGPVERHVTGRLVLTGAAALGLRKMLDDFIGKLESQASAKETMQ